jgi:prepilin-type N-terminal cleavage/methylation domain-containing protein
VEQKKRRVVSEKTKGFTLIEILVTVVILVILIVGVFGSLNWFRFFSKDRLITTCLVEGASSGIMACRGGRYIPNVICNVTYPNYTKSYVINIHISCNPSYSNCCSPPLGECTNATVIAIHNGSGKSFSLTDTICNF